MCWMCHGYLCAEASCVSMCVCLYALGGVAQALKMDPSGLTLSGRVPVEGKGALCAGTKMMMRRRRRDPVAAGRSGSSRGRSSLLMKSHLRPPFTLNMGHCSCPDLGFDPQRRLTPTAFPGAHPPCHLDGTHAYGYMSACTPKRCTCTDEQVFCHRLKVSLAAVTDWHRKV